MFSKLLLITLLTISPATTGKTSFMSIPKPLSYKERVGIKPFTSTLDEKQVKCLTDNIYFEARNENDNGKKITDEDILFIDERTDEYMKLVEDELAQNKNNVNKTNTINIVFNEEEEINVDDI
jgi:hypothetical protein